MNNIKQKSKRYKKNKKKQVTEIPYDSILTQFVCSECYSINIKFESSDKQTPLYKEKRELCSCCDKKTIQICIRDRQVSKALLETTMEKSKQEEKAYQLIKKSTRRK
mgnify:FL=1